MSPRRVPPSCERELDVDKRPASDLAEAARRLKAAARQLGFGPVGITGPTLPPLEQERLEGWLADGRQGDMAWIERDPAGRCDAKSLLDGAGAVLMVALPYLPEHRARPDPQPPATEGYVATYAQAAYDYHRVLAGRLEQLVRLYAQWVPGGLARRFCDTAPLLERAFARRAGLGFVGKNTCLIDPRSGSYVFLGGVILDRPLPLDAPDPLPSCGSCTRCLDACPTDAFRAPYELDSRRCIAYLTIEHRGAYAEGLRGGVGTHLFGCDICQSVCPWNEKFSPPADGELIAEDLRAAPDLLALYRRVRDGFKGVAKETAWARTGKRGFLRNLATAMGNAARPDLHREALEELANHEDAAVADHARWALARLDVV